MLQLLQSEQPFVASATTTWKALLLLLPSFGNEEKQMPPTTSLSSSSHRRNALSLSSSSSNSLPDATVAILEKQVVDETDLQRCAVSNHQKILVETLAQLKHELVAIQSDDWMFDNTPKNNGGDGLPTQFLSLH